MIDIYVMSYKIILETRSYEEYSVYNPITFDRINSFHFVKSPDTYKLFHTDIFNYCEETDQIQITYSPLRNNTHIPGILILDGGKTFGRHGKKMLYRCIPDDRHIPEFLIPYEAKTTFVKHLTNRFVLFHFKQWNVDDKHPIGLLTETLGNIDNLEAFYEYQLYRKSLQISMSILNTYTVNALYTINKQTIFKEIVEKYNLEDRTDINIYNIFTIDNDSTVDFDDAFDVRPVEGRNGVYTVSVYITNIVFIMEWLNMWNSLTRRVATIYLPDRRRPMLPSLLTEQLCSLSAGQERVCFVCDMIVNTLEEKIENIHFSNACVKISNNYTYESALIKTQYQLLQKVTESLFYFHKRPVGVRDVVAFWMTQMNTESAVKMMQFQTGIFRTVQHSGGSGGGSMQHTMDEIPTHLDTETVTIIRAWKFASGQYITYNNCNGHEHCFLKKNAYVHITSPLRRLVDLLNQMIFLQNNPKRPVILSDSAQHFLSKWMDELEYINITMRSIKKVQTDCETLYRCTTEPDILDKEYTGVIFDCLEKRDCGLVTYMVYLKDLHLLSRINLYEKMENYQTARFKICMFKDKDNLQKKIRLLYCCNDN